MKIAFHLLYSVILLALFPSFLSAQINHNNPYGGQVVNSINCTCSGNVLIYVFDFRTNRVLPIVYQPGVSTLYLNYNVSSAGAYHLGTYTAGGPRCLVPSGTSCNTIPSVGFIDSAPGTGTS